MAEVGVETAAGTHCPYTCQTGSTHSHTPPPLSSNTAAAPRCQCTPGRPGTPWSHTPAALLRHTGWTHTSGHGRSRRRCRPSHQPDSTEGWAAQHTTALQDRLSQAQAHTLYCQQPHTAVRLLQPRRTALTRSRSSWSRRAADRARSRPRRPSWSPRPRPPTAAGSSRTPAQPDTPGRSARTRWRPAARSGC